MSFQSLIPKICRRFSHSKLKVILLQDYPSVGFQGQVVKVKPGYAETYLIPKNIAVYHFPQLHERLFPNWDENEVYVKKEQLELKNFIRKFDNLNLDLKKIPSATNPTFMKEPLKRILEYLAIAHICKIAKDITDSLKARLGLDVPPQNVKFPEDINQYGSFILAVEGYHNERFNRRFNFKLRVNLEPEVVAEPIEETR